MVFKAISIIFQLYCGGQFYWWRRENHRPVASHWQTLLHNIISNTPRHERYSNSQHLWWYALIAQEIQLPHDYDHDGLTIRIYKPQQKNVYNQKEFQNKTKIENINSERPWVRSNACKMSVSLLCAYDPSGSPHTL